MPKAVGVIQTDGFPPVLAAADAMVKAGAVTLVYYGLAERAELSSPSVAMSRKSSKQSLLVSSLVKKPNGGVVSHYIIPNPPENLESVLPIQYNPDSEEFWI